MTLKEAKTAVKVMGLRLTWNSDLREYTVHPAGCFGHGHEPCYFTDDRDDAVGTAKAMAVEALSAYPRPVEEAR